MFVRKYVLCVLSELNIYQTPRAYLIIRTTRLTCSCGRMCGRSPFSIFFVDKRSVGFEQAKHFSFIMIHAYANMRTSTKTTHTHIPTLTFETQFNDMWSIISGCQQRWSSPMHTAVE